MTSRPGAILMSCWFPFFPDWSRWKTQSNIFSIIYCCRISWSFIDIQWLLLVFGWVKLISKLVFHLLNIRNTFLGPPNPENVPEDGKLKSEMMIKDNRRYYLDLKENTRGRFLRVSSNIPYTVAAIRYHDGPFYWLIDWLTNRYLKP